MSPALQAGFRGLRRGFTSVRLVLLLWTVNLLLASVAILPLAQALHHLMSPLGDGLEWMREWPFWLDTDFRVQAAPALDAFGPLASLVTAIYLLLSPFLSAGILGILQDAEGAFSPGSFCRGGGRYGCRFLRLLFLFLLCGWLLQWLVGGQLQEAVRWLRFDWPSHRGVFLLDLAHQVVYLAAFYALVAVFELARIRIVVEKRRSALLALLAGAAFCASHAGGTLLALGLVAALQMAVVLVAGELLSRLSPASGTGLLGYFLLTQVLVAARLAFRVSYLESGRLWFQAAPAPALRQPGRAGGETGAEQAEATRA